MGVTADDNQPLLEVRHLTKDYAVGGGLLRRGRGLLRAVDDVSFCLDRGRTLGLVGESGCGKTTTGRAILRLVQPTAGAVLFRTQEQNAARTHDVLHLPARELRRLRRHMQMVFQDPHGSLDPRMTVGATVAEGMTAHGLYTRAARRVRVGQLLERVGLDPGAADKYPHAFSGGQRQRIGIARALAVEPSFLVCDEAVSALDVSVGAQILNLLIDLQRERNLSYLFIAHDLAAVVHVSQRVAVMYHGQIVELADSADLYQHPAHPYTRALLAAVPKGWPEKEAEPLPCPDDQPAAGTPAAGAAAPKQGCRFQPRCPVAIPECARVEPPLIQLGGGHTVRCHLATPVEDCGRTTQAEPAG
jgi:oligopeptide/dipeptide ABC transporter ATP-binding protein